MTRRLVEKIYEKAIADEAEVISQMWPSAAEQKRNAVAALGFPPSSEEWLRKRANPLSDAQIKSVAADHRKTVKKHLPSLTRYWSSQTCRPRGSLTQSFCWGRPSPWRGKISVKSSRS